MAYMDRSLENRGLSSVAPAPHRWLSEGIGVGVLGGATVALWFLLIDLIMRTPFFTPAALGSVLFRGASGPTEVEQSLTTIGGYTIVHFAVFMALGILFTWMVSKVESRPRQWLIAVMAFILLDGLFAGTVMMVGEWVISSLGVWAIAIANVLAIAVMGGTVWATHPQLRHDLADKQMQTSV